MRRIFALFEKDLKNGLRNWEILFIILVPIVLSLFFKIAFSSRGYSRPRVAVFCADEELKTALSSIEQFKEIQFFEKWDEAVSMVEKGKVDGAFRIPEDFVGRAKAQERPEIEVLLDSTTPVKAAVIRAALKSFTDKYFEIVSPVKVTIKQLKVVTPKQRILPIWVLVIIGTIGLVCVPLSLGEVRKEKTLDAVLLTPTSEREVILAKAIWASFLILMSEIVLLLLNNGLTGNNGLLLVILLLGIFSVIGIGLFISIVSPTQTTSSLASTLVMLVILLSAVATTLGGPMKRFLWVLPGYQIHEGVRKAIFLKVGFTEVWENLLVLFGWTVVFLWINVWALKRQKL